MARRRDRLTISYEMALALHRAEYEWIQDARLRATGHSDEYEPPEGPVLVDGDKLPEPHPGRVYVSPDGRVVAETVIQWHPEVDGELHPIPHVLEGRPAVDADPPNHTITLTPAQARRKYPKATRGHEDSLRGNT